MDKILKDASNSFNELAENARRAFTEGTQSMADACSNAAVEAQKNICEGASNAAESCKLAMETTQAEYAEGTEELVFYIKRGYAKHG